MRSLLGSYDLYSPRGRGLARLLLAFLTVLLSGCAVGYTFFNSESKLDRLTVSMPKDAVLDQLGRPDLVLRDDGRVTVWQYNLNTTRQWLYELSLCPVSVWVGGCLFYPFTNWVSDRHREHAVHLILVNDQLCTWGLPVALMQKKKGCTGLASFEDERLATALRQGDVLTTGYGPINQHSIEKYQTVAVWGMADAPGAAGSGSRVASVITNLLLDLDLTVVERARLEQVFDEQVVQLSHSDEANMLRVGQIAGAKAIIVGDIQQWSVNPSERTASVGLSFRLVDVETGQVLFNGEGHSMDSLSETPENLARLIVHRIITRFAVKAGLLGTGRIGVRWEWRAATSEGGGYLVHEVTAGSPAHRAGLQIGDVVLTCHNVSLSALTPQQGKQACRVEAGQLLSMDVQRGDEHLQVDVLAEPRPGI